MTLDRELVDVVGVWLLAAATLSFGVVWMTAFVNGEPVLVSINAYGERWVEFGAWLVTSVFGTVAVHDETRGVV